MMSAYPSFFGTVLLIFLNMHIFEKHRKMSDRETLQSHLNNEFYNIVTFLVGLNLFETEITGKLIKSLFSS